MRTFRVVPIKVQRNVSARRTHIVAGVQVRSFVFHVAPYPLHKDIVPAMPSCQPRSRRGEEGFSSCLAHPCQHAVGFTALKETVASVRLRRVLLPSPVFCGLGLRSLRFSRPHRRSLALRPGDSRLSRG